MTPLKVRHSVANLLKITLYNPNIHLVNDNVVAKFVSICLLVLKILSKNKILKSIKGRNSVANL